MLLNSPMSCTADSNGRILHVLPHGRTVLLDSIYGIAPVVFDMLPRIASVFLDLIPHTWGMFFDRVHRIAPVMDHVAMYNPGCISDVFPSLAQMVVCMSAENLKPLRHTVVVEVHRKRNTKCQTDQTSNYSSNSFLDATDPILGLWINKVPFLPFPSPGTLATSIYILWYAMV